MELVSYCVYFKCNNQTICSKPYLVVYILSFKSKSIPGQKKGATMKTLKNKASNLLSQVYVWRIAQNIPPHESSKVCHSIRKQWYTSPIGYHVKRKTYLTVYSFLHDRSSQKKWSQLCFFLYSIKKEEKKESWRILACRSIGNSFGLLWVNRGLWKCLAGAFSMHKLNMHCKRNVNIA